MDFFLKAKAKRRIRRFIKTGKHQARTYQVGKNLFEYKTVHHVKSLFFKRDILGRIRLIE